VQATISVDSPFSQHGGRKAVLLQKKEMPNTEAKAIKSLSLL
jgi:hypothetical protein